jgi:hypothetical protein
VVAELRRIADENGGELRPVDVVAAARPAKSVLHRKFTWDDTAAAEQWRLQQARQLIRVTVEYIGTGDSRVVARTFVSLKPDRESSGGGYRAMVSVLSNTEFREQLMADAMEDMVAFRKRYSALKELSEVFAAMRRVKRPKAA